jgi:uroporphyrin-III C-methyltransferase
MSGTVYLVGAGPGAADLLTVRAARLLGEAEIVFHDALVPAKILALAAGAICIPVGKRCGRYATAQRFINKQLADAARKHRVVVRLKGGDPMLFGRAQEEIGYLRSQGIHVEVVPGVTAALAASAELGVSLTQRGRSRSVAFVTPRVGVGEAPSNWLHAALAADTAVIYMGAGDAAAISAALIAAGKPTQTPVAIVASASLPQARIAYGTVAEMPKLVELAGGAPALLLIGQIYSRMIAQAVEPKRGAAA